MKRYSFSILLAFLLTIGCQEEISIREGRFRAVIESFQNSVKTAMDEERNVVWSKGDMHKRFQGYPDQHKQYDYHSGGNSREYGFPFNNPVYAGGQCGRNDPLHLQRIRRNHC